MKYLILTFAVIIIASTSAFGQQNYSITSQGAGGVKLGMTIAQARNVLKGCRLARTSDGEGVALVGVKCRGKQVMTLYADEPNAAAPINYRSRIELIQVWDPRFKTSGGVHVGMLVSNVEKKLGKVTEIVLTQTESREFITFTKQPANISFRIYGGIYAPRTAFTKKYEKGTKLHSIQVSKY